MASPLLACPYFALVALFYRQSDGFIQKYDNSYEYWKTLPVLILSVLCYLIGAGLRGRERAYTALGLLFGALGDYLICRTEDGLITGATAFGIGHIFYLLTFAHRVRQLHYTLTLLACISGSLVVCGVTPIVADNRINGVIVLTYSFLLSTCLVLSGSLYFHGARNEPPHQLNNLLRFIGFSLFYGSDTMLILQHVGFRIPFAEKLILLSYFLAQYLIVWATCMTHRICAERHLANRLR
uniref:lysoplasmalogenase n=1 Tax=Parascaris univalens TaxID=6257 RepID=A0A915AYB8_PARUN